jgi:hypothetical protein
VNASTAGVALRIGSDLGAIVCGSDAHCGSVNNMISPCQHPVSSGGGSRQIGVIFTLVGVRMIVQHDCVFDGA